MNRARLIVVYVGLGLMLLALAIKPTVIGGVLTTLMAAAAILATATYRGAS